MNERKMKMTYKIFEGNLERLEKKLTKISNKCTKYGCDFHYQQVGEVFEEVKDEKGETHVARFVLIEAEGTAKVNDWQFIATVEHTEKGNIIEGYSGIEVPERYYSGKPVCEHCNSNRYRKNTYIIRNVETGEFKQVGKSCLKDFTQGLSAEMVAQYISGFQELIEGETPSGGCWFPRYINKNEFLAYAAETIRCFGYVKRNYDVPGTAERAIDFYDAAHGRLRPTEYQNDVLKVMKKANFNPENRYEYVKSALDWLDQQPESNNYFHNLKVACSLEYTGIDEINEQNETGYQIEDVRFEFTHEVMSNEQENKQNDLTDAQRKQTEINTLLNIANVLDQETIVQAICEILDIDYEDIKDKLPDDEAAKTGQVQQQLDDAVVTDGEGGGEGEQGAEAGSASTA